MNADDLALRALDLATAGLSVAKIADMLDTTVKDVKALISETRATTTPTSKPGALTR